MRGLKTIVVALAVALSLAGSAMAFHQGSEGTEPPPLPATKAEEVWTYITVWNPYKGWALWPGKKKLFPGTEPHGALLTVYVSDDARETILDKGGTFGNGAIIVKENYTPDKTLAAVTVMYKRTGYNPGGGDWYWAKYSADGTVDRAGKVEGCIKCHSARSGNDWVFTGAVGK